MFAGIAATVPGCLGMEASVGERGDNVGGIGSASLGAITRVGVAVTGRAIFDDAEGDPDG